MTPFDSLTAIAAPLPVANVDTDMILPARYLTTITRAGLGQGLFATQRQEPEFILNRMPWAEAGILVALDNFGCGSSREHAPWALLDFGIRCVIAPGFADIFFNNCCKNGILPVILQANDVARLMALAADPATAMMTVNLPAQTVETCEGSFTFAIAPARKDDLLVGRDEIAVALGHAPDIAGFEAERAGQARWLPRIAQATLDAL